MKTLLVSFFALALPLTAACAAPTEEPTDALTAVESAQSTKPACTPDTAARRTATPVAKPSVQGKIDAWTAANAAHAQAAVVIGRSCTTSADCVTGDAAFPGVCATPYYGEAQCIIPAAPSNPGLSCADYTCPANFECEQEGSESMVCLEHRLCREEGGSSGGGSGGGRRGR